MRRRSVARVDARADRRALPAEQQQVLTLKFVFNFSNAEVATILGKTEGAIKSLQHRALVSLQKQIGDGLRRPSLVLSAAWHSRSASSACRARARRRCSPRSPGRRAATTARRTSAWRRSPTSASTSSPRSCRRARSRRRRSASSDVPGTGPALLGNLRQVDALLVVLRRLLAGRRSGRDDLETLKLELLVADRDHVERRLERVEKQAKSGDAKLRKRGRGARSGARPPRRRARRSPTARASCRRELEPLTTKPLLAIVNGPAGIDLKLEAELAELRRGGGGGVPRRGESALERGRPAARRRRST